MNNDNEFWFTVYCGVCRTSNSRSAPANGLLTIQQNKKQRCHLKYPLSKAWLKWVGLNIWIFLKMLTFSHISQCIKHIPVEQNPSCGPMTCKILITFVLFYILITWFLLERNLTLFHALQFIFKLMDQQVVSMQNIFLKLD
jgi:hypothetical protein